MSCGEWRRQRYKSISTSIQIHLHIGYTWRCLWWGSALVALVWDGQWCINRWRQTPDEAILSSCSWASLIDQFRQLMQWRLETKTPPIPRINGDRGWDWPRRLRYLWCWKCLIILVDFNSVDWEACIEKLTKMGKTLTHVLYARRSQHSSANYHIFSPSFGH